MYTIVEIDAHDGTIIVWGMFKNGWDALEFKAKCEADGSGIRWRRTFWMREIEAV